MFEQQGIIAPEADFLEFYFDFGGRHEVPPIDFGANFQDFLNFQKLLQTPFSRRAGGSLSLAIL